MGSWSFEGLGEELAAHVGGDGGKQAGGCFKVTGIRAVARAGELVFGSTACRWWKPEDILWLFMGGSMPGYERAYDALLVNRVPTHRVLSLKLFTPGPLPICQNVMFEIAGTPSLGIRPQPPAACSPPNPSIQGSMQALCWACLALSWKRGSPDICSWTPGSFDICSWTPGSFLIDPAEFYF